MRPLRVRLLVLAALAAAAIAMLWLGGFELLTLAGLKARHAALLAAFDRAPLQLIAGFVALQVAALTLCVPGAVLIAALAGGAVFGPVLGTAVVLAALTIGDSLGFLAARLLLRDWVRRRFGGALADAERGLAQSGPFYLVALRLMAIVPYFVVNLTFALTAMRLRSFAPLSLIALAPSTAIYVNAGTQLSRIQRPGDILTPRLLLTFALLALLPLVARWLIGRRPRG